MWFTDDDEERFVFDAGDDEDDELEGKWSHMEEWDAEDWETWLGSPDNDEDDALNALRDEMDDEE